MNKNKDEKMIMFLKNWKITRYDGDVIIFGYIYGDEKGRFPDGTYIHTSKVLNADFGKGIIKTKNSTYFLEK